MKYDSHLCKILKCEGGEIKAWRARVSLEYHFYHILHANEYFCISFRRAFDDKFFNLIGCRVTLWSAHSKPYLMLKNPI